jgi:cytochrome c-type protein NapC
VGRLLPAVIIIAFILAAVLVVACYLAAPALVEQRWGRIALLAGVVAVPVLSSGAGLTYGVRESSTTRFCLSCHEMQPYGKSLFADNRRALSATHYQNRLIDRERTCYGCHADYGLFGDLQAKVNGLRHVWAHYSGRIPEKIALYQPYGTANCLKCHDDGRRFQEAAGHAAVLGELVEGRRSCLACHTPAHDMASVADGRLWQAVVR